MFVPGWALMASGVLLIILFQAVSFTVGMVFLVLGNRQQVTFIPRRDYGLFVASVREHSGTPQATA
jgi:hypothetical protein